MIDEDDQFYQAFKAGWLRCSQGYDIEMDPSKPADPSLWDLYQDWLNEDEESS